MRGSEKVRERVKEGEGPQMRERIEERSERIEVEKERERHQSKPASQ